MIIKSFTGESAAAALKKVRTDMGGDAVVLKTREIAGDPRHRFEITACLDKPSVAQSSTLLAEKKEAPTAAVRKQLPPVNRMEAAVESPDKATIEEMYERMRGIERKLDRFFSTGSTTAKTAAERNEGVQKLYSRLVDADVPEEYISMLLSTTIEDCADVSTLPGEFAREIETSFVSMAATDLEFKPGDTLLFVGPPASGKTSALGKLAAHLVLHSNKKVNLVSLDTLKVGAYDEIHNYGDLLGVDVTDAFQSNRVEMPPADAITLIDSPGLSADLTRRQQILDKVKHLNPTYCFATLSALTRSSDVERFLNWINPFSPTHLIGTMLDVTERFGSLVAAANQSSLRIAFTSDAPGGMGSIKTFDAAGLAGRITGPEVGHE